MELVGTEPQEEDEEDEDDEDEVFFATALCP